MKTKLFSTHNIRGYRGLRATLCVSFFIVIMLFQTACKKFVTIDPPISSIRSDQVFATDVQAKAAMAGVYTLMINGTSLTNNTAANGFAMGLTTIIGGSSSDEITSPTPDAYMSNKINPVIAFYGSTEWTSAYKVIYGANAIIEGIQASASGDLSDGTRAELTAEAKFVRAFSYSYLVGLFGDVPLALTIDFNKTQLMSRTPQSDVYKQIIQDLKDAQAILPADYSNNPGGLRIIPNKWAATALLARMYLYTGDYANAAAQSSAVIGNSQYQLAADLNGVFATHSQEAIWQLQQNINITSVGNATVEGFQFIPAPTLHTGLVYQYMSNELIAGIDSSRNNTDNRWRAWVDSTTSTVYNGQKAVRYFPFKYKTGTYNFTAGAAATEYYMVLRLAEQYLIRAEAEYRGANGGASAAIADLNVIRNRAKATPLPNNLTSDQLLQAVAHERQIELFCEWGHRWFDLRRLGLAHNVLSAIDRKTPWAGDYQFLYPIPVSEIVNDHYLIQNPGYN